MGSIIGGVAVEGFVVHGHCPIATDGEAKEQLLQIGTKVFRDMWLATYLELCGVVIYVANSFQLTPGSWFYG
jgi:hypothetical protein